jgi:Saxitoxin biosynthesis operon protein SxtJ
MDHVIPDLDRHGLRRFGLVTGAIVAVLFGLAFPWLLGRAWPWWPWALFAILGGLGLAVPEWLGPIYKGWMRFGLLASRVTTPLILGIVFFLVVSPMALVKRVTGRDAMARNFDKDAPTYRVVSTRKPAEDLERPF